LIKEAKGRLDRLLDEFNNIAIEDDVNEERINNLLIKNSLNKAESPKQKGPGITESSRQKLEMSPQVQKKQSLHN
jgi:hypothetical protein